MFKETTEPHCVLVKHHLHKHVRFSSQDKKPRVGREAPWEGSGRTVATDYEKEQFQLMKTYLAAKENRSQGAHGPRGKKINRSSGALWC